MFFKVITTIKNSCYVCVGRIRSKKTRYYFFTVYEHLVKKIVWNVCGKINFLILFIFLFLTTSIWALEDHFEIIKNPYQKPIVLSDFSNLSWDDITFTSSHSYKGLISTNGMAKIFRWNGIYLTYLTDNNTLQIKKLNATGTAVEDFLTINNCNFQEFENNEFALGVYGCTTLCETSDDCYIYFFYLQSEIHKLAITRVSLKTKEVVKQVEDSRFLPIDAVTYNGYIYILSCNLVSYSLDDANLIISQFNPENSFIISTTSLPKCRWLF